MSEYTVMDDAEIFQKIDMFHKWELREAVLNCFAIRPETFDWKSVKNQNSDPMRVYNWCLHLIHGGDLQDGKSSKGTAKQSAKLVAIPACIGGENTYMVLRDVFIKFCFENWPDFTARTHKIAVCNQRDSIGRCSEWSSRSDKCVNPKGMNEPDPVVPCASIKPNQRKGS